MDMLAERQASFILLDGRAYSLAETNTNPDFLRTGGIRFDLIPSLTFLELENLSEKLQTERIETYCTEYIKARIDQKIKRQDEIDREGSRLKSLDYAMSELLPFLLSKKYDDDDNLLLSLISDDDDLVDEITPQERAKKEIQEILKSRFGEVEGNEEEINLAEEMRLSLLREEKNNLESEIGFDYNEHVGSLYEFSIDTPLFISNNLVYSLIKIENPKEDESIIHVNNESYRMHARADMHVSDLSERLLDKRKNIWRIAALERTQTAFDEINNRKREKDASKQYMRKLAELDELNLDNLCGFFIKSGDLYVYTQVPKFATQDSRDVNRFWPYDSTKVAIRLNWSRGQIYSSDSPIIVEPREHHPCLRNRTSGNSSICNLSRDSGDYGHTKIDLVRKISDAATALMEPLNPGSLKSHPGPNHRFFGDPVDDILGGNERSLTRKQAHEQGYMIVEVVERGYTGEE